MLLRRCLQQRCVRTPPISRHFSSSLAFMEDEYKEESLTVPVHLYQSSRPFVLENGQQLEQLELCYTTYGQLNAQRNNVIVLCHALTGHSLVHQWWDAMVTPEWTDKYFIVCANILGSCYGSTGPTSINPTTQQPYGATFPQISMRDAVRAQKQLLQEELQVNLVKSVIGGSMGGMQTLEWAFEQEFVQSFIPIACGSHHSAWQIGISELQRQAIAMDPDYQNGQYDPAKPPTQGLALARQIAMVSYRTHAAYREKYGRERVDDSTNDRFLVQSYLEYQGTKFLSRFDVNSYVTLTHLMDSHDVGRDRGGIPHALSTLTQPSLVVGIDSDVLYPLQEQVELAQQLPNASLEVISSPHGHDAFLLEQHAISALATKFLDECVH